MRLPDSLPFVKPIFHNDFLVQASIHPNKLLLSSISAVDNPRVPVYHFLSLPSPCRTRRIVTKILVRGTRFTLQGATNPLNRIGDFGWFPPTSIKPERERESEGFPALDSTPLMNIESLLNERDAPTGTNRESESRRGSSQTLTNHISPELLSRERQQLALRLEAAQSAETSVPKALTKLKETAVKAASMATYAAQTPLPYYNPQPNGYMHPISSDVTDPSLAPPHYIDTSASRDPAPNHRPPRKTTQTNERPLLCNECQKTFSRRSDLVRHERIHSGDRPHPCTFAGCEKSFIQRSALTVHERTHTGEKPHTCDECSKPFSDSSSLARHRRTHTGLRPYACDYPGCDKDFTRRTTLKRHMETHGPLPETDDQNGQSEHNPDHSAATSTSVPLQRAAPEQALEVSAERPRKRQNRKIPAPDIEHSFAPNSAFQQTLARLTPDQNAIDQLQPQRHSPASPTSYPMPTRQNISDAAQTVNARAIYAIQDQDQMYKHEGGHYPPLDEEYHAHMPHTYYPPPPKPLDPNDNNYYAHHYDWQPSPNSCKTQFGNGYPR